jgi:hypothetical protein
MLLLLLQWPRSRTPLVTIGETGSSSYDGVGGSSKLNAAARRGRAGLSYTQNTVFYWDYDDRYTHPFRVQPQPREPRELCEPGCAICCDALRGKLLGLIGVRWRPCSRRVLVAQLRTLTDANGVRDGTSGLGDASRRVRNGVVCGLSSVCTCWLIYRASRVSPSSRRAHSTK